MSHKFWLFLTPLCHTISLTSLNLVSKSTNFAWRHLLMLPKLFIILCHRKSGKMLLATWKETFIISFSLFLWLCLLATLQDINDHSTHPPKGRFHRLFCALFTPYAKLLRSFTGAKVGRRARIGRKQFMKLTPGCLKGKWLSALLLYILKFGMVYLR